MAPWDGKPAPLGVDDGLVLLGRLASDLRLLGPLGGLVLLLALLSLCPVCAFHRCSPWVFPVRCAPHEPLPDGSTCSFLPCVGALTACPRLAGTHLWTGTADRQ